MHADCQYLVECSGELVQLLRGRELVPEEPDWKTMRRRAVTRQFEAYKLDARRHAWGRVEDMGYYAVFLGRGTATAVRASRRAGCDKNCIYFTDDEVSCHLAATKGGRGGGADIGVHRLGNEAPREFAGFDSRSPFSPHVWVVPSC